RRIERVVEIEHPMVDVIKITVGSDGVGQNYFRFANHRVAKMPAPVPHCKGEGRGRLIFNADLTGRRQNCGVGDEHAIQPAKKALFL
ncbi:MAG: hypothetical protein Q7S99_00960, partial [Parvibaculum sp.]|nr:hypothetical protein [Parvibaculum sp.]